MPALHITNGDSAAATLRTFLDDPVVITADPLFAGPAPEVGDAEWYALRATHLAGGGEAGHHTAEQLSSWDRGVAEALQRGDELVLWFEHDLFDQLLLIRLLDRIGSQRGYEADRSVSMICIDRFPGVDRFVGLGQLTAEQLGTLTERRLPVSAAQFEHARAAWAAFRSADPTNLVRLTAPGPLPFLGAAIHRFLQEYPSTRNGLSRSAAQVLHVLGDEVRDAGRVFVASQALEESPFMGDWGLFDVIRALGGGTAPLVTINPESRGVDLRGHAIRITAAGRSVRNGDLDWVALNGIDEWRGGVHLRGARTSPWRWDDTRQTLIESGR